MNRIVGFGDSFTSGEGWNEEKELKIIQNDDKVRVCIQQFYR